MKHIKTLLMVLSVMALLTGCLQLETSINVNKDGSGTVEQTFLMKYEIIEMLQGFSAMGEDGGEEFSLYDEEELEENAFAMGDGVSIKSAGEYSNDWGEGYQVIYWFDDINDLKINQNPGEMVPSSDGDDESIQEYITFDFKPGRTAELVVYMPGQDMYEDEDSDYEGGSSDQEDMPVEMMQQFYGDMRITMNIEVDGTISDTNATYVEGNEILLMDIDFNNVLSDPKIFKEITGSNVETIEEMKDIVDSVDGISVELEEKVVIKFR